jgi:hypothetical protein
MNFLRGLVDACPDLTQDQLRQVLCAVQGQYEAALLVAAFLDRDMWAREGPHKHPFLLLNPRKLGFDYSVFEHVCAQGQGPLDLEGLVLATEHFRLIELLIANMLSAADPAQMRHTISMQLSRSVGKALFPPQGPSPEIIADILLSAIELGNCEELFCEFPAWTGLIPERYANSEFGVFFRRVITKMVVSASIL